MFDATAGVLCDGLSAFFGGTVGPAVGLICDSERASGIGAATGGVTYGAGSIGTLAVGGSAIAPPVNAKVVKAIAAVKARFMVRSSRRHPVRRQPLEFEPIVGFSCNSRQGGL